MAKGRSNKLRIIGGSRGGRVIRFPDARGLRPTADRVRETLFNWLQTEISGAHCLDLFAGSGALGMEALSRGAAHALFVDRSRSVCQQLTENLRLLGMEPSGEVRCGDALRFLADPPEQQFDIVFLDPPFSDGLLQQSARLLESANWLSPGALVYLEQDSNHRWPELPENWLRHRETRAGQAACRLLRRSG